LSLARVTHFELTPSRSHADVNLVSGCLSASSVLHLHRIVHILPPVVTVACSCTRSKVPVAIDRSISPQVHFRFIHLSSQSWAQCCHNTHHTLRITYVRDPLASSLRVGGTYLSVLCRAIRCSTAVRQLYPYAILVVDLISFFSSHFYCYFVMISGTLFWA
jgi:hypothetical protein